MATFTETPSFDSVDILETTDDVLGGGATSPSNKQAQKLVNRTKWLKDAIETINTALTSINQTIAKVVLRHATGTTVTRPPESGWTLDLATNTANAPFNNINLWSYNLILDCHLLRIEPYNAPFDRVNVVPSAGQRPTLYKINPPVGIYDGYELMLCIDCSASVPVARSARIFSVLGLYTIVNSGTNYTGNIVISNAYEQVIGLDQIRIRKDTPLSAHQMVCIGNAQLPSTESPNFNYAQNTLWIKLVWHADRNKWINVGISQPFTS